MQTYYRCLRIELTNDVTRIESTQYGCFCAKTQLHRLSAFKAIECDKQNAYIKCNCVFYFESTRKIQPIYL